MRVGQKLNLCVSGRVSPNSCFGLCRPPVCMCRCPLPLLITVLGLAKCGAFSTTLQSKHQSSNLAITFNRSTSPRISPNPCYKQWFFVRLSLSVGKCVGRFNFCEAWGFFCFSFRGRKSKLFDKALVVALACAALVMCLLLALAYHFKI